MRSTISAHWNANMLNKKAPLNDDLRLFVKSTPVFSVYSEFALDMFHINNNCITTPLDSSTAYDNRSKKENNENKNLNLNIDRQKLQVQHFQNNL